MELEPARGQGKARERELVREPVPEQGPALERAPGPEQAQGRGPGRTAGHHQQPVNHRRPRHMPPAAGPTALRTHTRGRARPPASIESPSRNLPNSLVGTHLDGVLMSSPQDSPATLRFDTSPQRSEGLRRDVSHSGAGSRTPTHPFGGVGQAPTRQCRRQEFTTRYLTPCNTMYTIDCNFHTSESASSCPRP